MSDYERILQLILDTGTYMIQSGAETHRVEDSLYRMCGSYGFSNCNIWVIPSNIQATAIAPDGSCLTQIRHIRRSGIDFERLDDLNTLSRRVCREQPGPDTFAELLAETDGPPQPAWVSYLAGALAGGGFGVFFNCDPVDAVAAVCTSLLVVFLSRRIERREHNPLITNFIISFLAEVFIIISARYGLGAPHWLCGGRCRHAADQRSGDYQWGAGSGEIGHPFRGVEHQSVCYWCDRNRHGYCSASAPVYGPEYQ